MRIFCLDTRNAVVLILPSLFMIGSYKVFFWSNENNEPIHVHIAHKPSANATKIWLTSKGGFILENNKSRIPARELNDMVLIIVAHYGFICDEWIKHFGSIKFYV